MPLLPLFLLCFYQLIVCSNKRKKPCDKDDQHKDNKLVQFKAKRLFLPCDNLYYLPNNANDSKKDVFPLYSNPLAKTVLEFAKDDKRLDSANHHFITLFDNPPFSKTILFIEDLSKRPCFKQVFGLDATTNGPALKLFLVDLYKNQILRELPLVTDEPKFMHTTKEHGLLVCSEKGKGFLLKPTGQVCPFELIIVDQETADSSTVPRICRVLLSNQGIAHFITQRDDVFCVWAIKNELLLKNERVFLKRPALIKGLLNKGMFDAQHGHWAAITKQGLIFNGKVINDGFLEVISSLCSLESLNELEIVVATTTFQDDGGDGDDNDKDGQRSMHVSPLQILLRNVLVEFSFDLEGKVTKVEMIKNCQLACKRIQGLPSAYLTPHNVRVFETKNDDIFEHIFGPDLLSTIKDSNIIQIIIEFAEMKSLLDDTSRTRQVIYYPQLDPSVCSCMYKIN